MAGVLLFLAFQPVASAHDPAAALASVIIGCGLSVLFASGATLFISYRILPKKLKYKPVLCILIFTILTALLVFSGLPILFYEPLGG